MRTLVIDSATEACSVALFENGELLARDFRMLGRGHAEQLVPMIAALPDRGKAQRIAVSLGPGSFTGVRVGLAAAKALAFAWQAELLGYPALDLVAAMALSQLGAQDLAVVMTGGHGELFVQGFKADGAPSRALASMALADAAKITPEACVAGSQAEALVAARSTGAGVPLWPDAACFALLNQKALTCDLSPLYGRPPDAKLPQQAS